MSTVNALSGSTVAAPESAYDTLTSEDFIRVMFAELTRQDPTKPTDSKDLLAQLGTIRSIESDLSLTRRLEDITRQNEITSAGGLVGKFVEGTTDSGTKTRGFVDSISITRLGIVLNLSSNHSVSLAKVEKVYDPALIAPAPTPDTPAAPAPTDGADDPGAPEEPQDADDGGTAQGEGSGA